MNVDSAPARLKALPTWLLNQAALPAQRLVSEGLERVGAHRYHYSVLAALDEGGPASQADLSRRCGIDRSDMVALINELAGRSVVERRPDPADRRRNAVSITVAGRRYLQELDDVLAAVQDELLDPLPSEERGQLVRLLTRIVAHHGGAGPSS